MLQNQRFHYYIVLFLIFYTKMLEYCKLILSKVSFSKELFEKELRKAIHGLLLKEEIKIFMSWCYQEFSKTYYSILVKYHPQVLD
jgi:hypothetical protein